MFYETSGSVVKVWDWVRKPWSLVINNCALTLANPWGAPAPPNGRGPMIFHDTNAQFSLFTFARSARGWFLKTNLIRLWPKHAQNKLLKLQRSTLSKDPSPRLQSHAPLGQIFDQPLHLYFICVHFIRSNMFVSKGSMLGSACDTRLCLICSNIRYLFPASLCIPGGRSSSMQHEVEAVWYDWGV